MTSDIFISYAREDREQVSSLARALRERGWSVWSDDRVVGGQLWKEEIEKALASAKCVVVIWSKASVESLWVLDEADDGRKRGILLPVLLDDVEIPLGFRQVQTINLSNGTDAESQEGLDNLIVGVARFLGSPRIQPREPPRGLRLLKTWAPPAIAIAPAAIAALLQVTPLAQTTVSLEATVSEISFVLPQEQDVFDLIVVSALEATGLTAIRIPRTRGQSEQILGATDGRGLAIRLSSATDTSHAGTITLPPLALSSGAHVTLLGATDSQRYRISFKQSALPVPVNVQGSLEVVLSRGAPQRIDFGAPKPLVLEPDQRGVDLGISPADGSRNLLAAPVLIHGLSLVRIDERSDTRRTDIQAVSTIKSGTLRLEALRGRERALGAGEGLRFGASQGELRALQLTDGRLSLNFRGQVRQMGTCSRHSCESWMPTYLESLAAQHTPLLIAFAAAYLLYLVAVGRRWRKVSGGSR